MRTRGTLVSVFLMLGSLASISASGQAPESAIGGTRVEAIPLADRVSTSPDYGTTFTNLLSLGPCDATFRDPLLPAKAANCDMVQPTSTTAKGAIGFPVHLPTGALVVSIKTYFFDTDATTALTMDFFRTTNGGALQLIQALSPGIVSSGFTSSTTTLGSPFPIDNSNGTYAILASLTKTASTTMAIQKIEISYRLQVSPAPATATFADVPVGNPQHRFVEALYASGVTAGCGGGNFCPDQAVTRGQMAVFLSVALGLQFPN